MSATTSGSFSQSSLYIIIRYIITIRRGNDAVGVTFELNARKCRTGISRSVRREYLMPLRLARRDRRRTISNRLICMRNTTLRLLATPTAVAKGVLPEPASPDANSNPGDQPANLPRRQFQPFCRRPWLELAVRHVLNHLESVQLAHRHRDPFRCSHRSLRRRTPGGRSAYAARKADISM